MGITSTFRLTKRVAGAPREFDLDKAAFELWQGLDALGLPGLRIVHGDDGKVSAADAERFHAQLSALSFERFWKAFCGTDLGKDADNDVRAFLEEYFPVLKAAYAAAMKGKCGLTVDQG